MIQKIIKVGNSIAVTLPKAIVEETGFTAGDQVEITTSKKPFGVLLQPHKKILREKSGITPEFVRSVDEFIETYRPALEELAHR